MSKWRHEFATNKPLAASGAATGLDRSPASKAGIWRPAARKRRSHPRFRNQLCDAWNAHSGRRQRHPCPDGDRLDASPVGLSDRAQPAAQYRPLLHRLRGRDRQRADDLAEQQPLPARSGFPTIYNPRHGCEPAPVARCARDSPACRRCRRFNGRHAGAAVGRQPSRSYAWYRCAGADGADPSLVGGDERGRSPHPDG